MSELAEQFTAITGASTSQAESYLRVSDYDVAQAVELWFATGGTDIDAGAQQRPPELPPRQTEGNRESPIAIDDDIEDADIQEAIRASEGSAPAAASGQCEDDEALARRLQEEYYGAGGLGDGSSSVGNGVRAPIPKTRETLIGGHDDDDEAYPYPGRRAPRQPGQVGIFNQRTTVWTSDDGSELTSEERRRQLSLATGGASDESAQRKSLAEMYRPPFEIISPLSLEEAREEARDVQKWILVNIQDNSVFDSQILNRDIWKASEVIATIRENFIFLQMDRAGRDGRDYVRLYIPQAAGSSAYDGLFPHISIIDPRTGEQVKVWNEMPKTPMEFVQQLHEFLDRYSLSADAKNPVQRKAKPKVDVDHMTEEEMMQLAMQESLGTGTGAHNHDPDSLTRSEEPVGDLIEFNDEESMPSKGKVSEVASLTPFQRIANDRHHSEPPPGPDCTRIQFKLHDGSRVVRRFLLKDTVERLFEYVKADLLPDQEAKKGEKGIASKEFELVALGKRLIEVLDQTVEEAGLKMGTIMVELVE